MSVKTVELTTSTVLDAGGHIKGQCSVLGCLNRIARGGDFYRIGLRDKNNRLIHFLLCKECKKHWNE